MTDHSRAKTLAFLIEVQAENARKLRQLSADMAVTQAKMDQHAHALKAAADEAISDLATKQLGEELRRVLAERDERGAA